MNRIAVISFAYLACFSGHLVSGEITLDHPIEVTPNIKGAIELTFATEVNKFYQVQVSDDLEDWDNEGYSIKGTGGQITQFFSTRNLPRVFYRLRDDGDPANLAPSVPPGTIVAFAGVNPPSGWLLCDGAVYPIEFAPTLHQTILNIYSDGTEEAGHFRVPNLNGRTTIGRGATVNPGPWGPTNWLVGQTFGSERVNITPENLPSHAHALQTGSTIGTSSAVVRASSNNRGPITTTTTGSDQPLIVMQPSLVISYIIKM